MVSQELLEMLYNIWDVIVYEMWKKMAYNGKYQCLPLQPLLLMKLDIYY